MVDIHQGNASSIDSDARRLALEAIATLVYVKKTAADQVLRRADIPEELIRRFLTERDPATGEKRSKRDAGAMVLDELERRGEIEAVVRKIVDIAAGWTSFHLAQNEYQARAVTQKAQELRTALANAYGRATVEIDTRRDAETEARRKQDADIVTRQSALLLAQFDQASTSQEHQQRGYLLEDLLNRAFDLHGIPVHKAFRRNGGGEQIDGAFELDGWHYIVECRWRQRLPDIRQLDGLIGQVGRSGRQTMGLFVSIEGWSGNVVPLLKQNPNKAIILMEGFDFRSVLDCRIGLRELLKAKIAALNIEAEPYFPASEMLRSV